jgi:hypothetical protein
VVAPRLSTGRDISVLVGGRAPIGARVGVTPITGRLPTGRRGSGFSVTGVRVRVRQFGAMPTVPVGHGCAMLRQCGGVPLVPDGHDGCAVARQCGGMPAVPDGHDGVVVRQCGGMPAVPGGHDGVVVRQ